MSTTFDEIEVVDTHTGGEPTRIVIAGGPDLGTGTLAERREIFRQHYNGFRTAVVHEPRGSDVLVAALLTEPFEPDCETGVLFFNNVGVLGMCGHGTIGLAAALGFLGRVTAGPFRIDTPVGVVAVDYDGKATASITNVPSHRFAKQVPVKLATGQIVHGDIAWGGNWFFLCEDHQQELSPKNTKELTAFAEKIRAALDAEGITGPKDGPNHGVIDHIELFAPPFDAGNHSRNFVLCPGMAYDRSPCGTGTSAKIACLAADGKLAPEEVWRQESIIGSVFTASYLPADADGLPAGAILPQISGQAYITGSATLLLDPDDPFRMGIPG